MTATTETTTAFEAATTSVFHKAEWKLNGEPIVAIHGYDQSTFQYFSLAPYNPHQPEFEYDWGILLTVVDRQKKQHKILVPSDEIITK